MYFIIITMIIAGAPPHPPARWHESYSTLAECRNAIPMVALQFQPEDGVIWEFDCAREERGA
jgi:hypothetical protein